MLVSRIIWTITLLLLYVHTSSSQTTVEWVKSASTSLSNVDLALSYASAALGSYNETKLHVSPGSSVSALTKATARLAGFFGVIGMVFASILELIPFPKEESAEIKVLRSEFGKLSQQIDTISKSVNDAKDLIKLSAQKAAFIKYENDINHGFSELNKTLNKLDNVECSGVTECKREKTLIAEGYINSMKVRKSTLAIVRAVTSDSAFGTSFMTLFKDNTDCDIPKINSFINKIATLVTKGMTVSIFHDLFKKYGYDYLNDVAVATQMFESIENARQTIQDSCFRDFDYWMARDIQNAYSLFTSDIQNSNTQLLRKLKMKYPWIVWHAVTYEGETSPETWSKTPILKYLHSSLKSQRIHSFVIPSTKEKVEKYEIKQRKWVDTILANAIKSGDVLKLSKLIDSNMELRGQVQSFAILSGTKWVSGHYKDVIETYTHGSPDYKLRRWNVFIYKPPSAIKYIIVVAFNQNSPTKCTGTFCRNKGHCYNYPYSSTKGCRCLKDYSGKNCESWNGDLELKSNINKLLKYTVKLPSFASMQHTIEDTQLLLRTSSENVQQSIKKLEAKIDQELKQLGTLMSNKFEWFALLQRYKDAIENINYFHNISSEKMTHFPQNTNFTIGTLTLKNNISRYAIIHEKDIAKFLLSPAGIQKWLYQINFLMVGRTDSDLFSHKSLTSMIMDKYKSRVCSMEYKNELTRTFRG